MRVAGVFVGVSAQDDPNIRQLNFGHRDAERLHAIFADANVAAGVSPTLVTLLTNERATCQAFREAFRAAADAVKRGDADVLVVHFSCHGSQSGHLVLYDTYVDHLSETTIGLNEVAETLAEIPVDQVVITLDCCFSGAVLGQPGSLNRDAFDRFMQPLRGEGRFVVWAADPDEQAYENSRLAHGYLSYALAVSLDTFRATGRRTVGIPEWLTTSIDHAKALIREAGRAQTPGGYVRLGPEELIHVPPVGDFQRRIVEDVGIIPVDPALESLAVYGFSPEEVGAIRRRIATGALNKLQRDAISPGGLLAGRSLMIRAPTTGGKTLVGELAMLHHRRQGRKTIVLLPTRALARQQADGFQGAYRELGLRVIMSTGEVVDDDDLFRRDQYDVAVFTYEKFAAVVAARPSALEPVGVIVFDEIQMIEDDSRGKSVELLLLRLRRHQQREGGPQLVVLCAEVEDLGRLAEWLALQSVGPGERPVPLIEGVFTSDGRWQARDPRTGIMQIIADRGWPASLKVLRPQRYDDDRRLNVAVQLASQLVRDGKQVLVFVNTRGRAINVARWISEELQLPAVDELTVALKSLPEGDRHRARERLLECAEHGVAFHIADLEQAERRLVEDVFRGGRLRALTATTTLAMGINSPADAVIMVDDQFYQGPARGNRDMRLSEYRNMAGRAGRLVPGGPPEGRSYLIASHEQHARVLLVRYINPTPSGLVSRMNEEPLEDLFLALLQVRGEAGLQQLADDVGGTFWGYVSRRDPEWLPRLRRELDKTVIDLQKDGFIQSSAPPLLSLTQLGAIAAGFGIRAESARRVKRALEQVIQAKEPIDDVALLALVQTTLELEEVLMPPHAGPRVVEWEMANRGVLRDRPVTYAALTDTTSLSPDQAHATIADRLHRFAGIVAWLRGIPLRDVESAYTRVAGDDPLLSRLRGAADRSADMIFPIMSVARILLPDRSEQLQDVATTLRARLEIGGDAVASQLHRLRLGLSRHECLALVQLRIDGEGALRQAIASRRAEVEAALTTTRMIDLERQLNDTRLSRRRRASGDQLLLDIVGQISKL